MLEAFEGSNGQFGTPRNPRRDVNGSLRDLIRVSDGAVEGKDLRNSRGIRDRRFHRQSSCRFRKLVLIRDPASSARVQRSSGKREVDQLRRIGEQNRAREKEREREADNILWFGL